MSASSVAERKGRSRSPPNPQLERPAKEEHAVQTRPLARNASERSSVPMHVAPAALAHVESLMERFANTPDASKLVFVMVGLPARGKSFVSIRLARFLRWTGTETRVFNAGNHRRNTETGVQDASYFDPKAAASVQRRDQIAMDVLTDMMTWLDGGAERFAVFDATNTTRTRRLAVAKKLRSNPGLGVIFVESVCEDPAILEANVIQKLEKSPDYRGWSQEAARADLLRRVQNYANVYEPIDETDLDLGDEKVRVSYIKMLNLSSHVVAHNIWGRAAMVVLPYLMALHVGSRPIWLTRLPHTDVTPRHWRKQGKAWPPPSDIQFSEQHLSPRGAAFANALASYISKEAPNIAAFSSTHRRGLEVVAKLGGGRVRTSLNPQDRGLCDGMTSTEIENGFPDIWKDPLRRRFPGGGSLQDMVQRLLPTLTELEQEMRPVLVVAPLSALQILYCYYTGRSIAEALCVQLPMHALIEICPDGGNFNVRQVDLEGAHDCRN